MDTASIAKKFRTIGADAEVGRIRPNRWNRRRISVDVNNGVFDIRADKNVEVQVVDFDAKLRHLLLHVNDDGEKHKFLCGHDERDWFVAAVPGNGINGIDKAMEALKPQAAREAQSRAGVRRKNRHRRNNDGFRRQGEWFFIPQPGFEPSKDAIVLKDEPISRGRGSKPHNCEMMIRSGGETVYVHPTFAGSGISQQEFDRRRMEAQANGDSRFRMGWRQMQRDAKVYVKGRISHSDHATITLDCWHLVEMNTESNAPAMQHVVFLD
tara:strand:+ start:96402 stop:97202 length:801 start_codon:yes stop_codon:yes gene_type:complete